MRERPHMSASTIPSIAIDADYSEEARIAGLEGRVVLAGTKVIESLGLGLDEQAIEAAQKGDTGVFALETHFLHADFLLR